jgi:hypothetical protein
MGERMNTMVSKTWNRDTRAGKIESILLMLNRSGKAEITYFKEKSNIVSYYLWRGNPQPVKKDDDWNVAKITYDGKLALEFIELWVPPFAATPEFEGHFFDEHFSESETHYILDALKSVELITYREFLSRKKKVFLSFVIVFYVLFTLHVLRLGSYFFSIVLLSCVFLAACLLFHK